MQQEDSWNEYYKKTRHQPPRKTLLKALELFRNEQFSGFAIDLGCGSGRDTVELLQNEWTVLGIDKEQEAIDFLKDALSSFDQSRFDFQCADFETIELPPADLINASYALPFCQKACFPSLWSEIRSSLKQGARFSGQFLGERDDWAGLKKILSHTKAEVDELLQSFEIEFFEEEEVDEKIIEGDLKHWHIFHVVARKVRQKD